MYDSWVLITSSDIKFCMNVFWIFGRRLWRWSFDILTDYFVRLPRNSSGRICVPKKVSNSSAHDDDEEKIRKRKKMMKKIWEKERRWWEKWEEKKMMRKACEEKWKAAGAELLIVWGANKKLMKCFSPGIMVMMKVEQSWWKYIFIYLKFIFLHMLIVCIEN